jgi:hypothetical protein
MPDADFASWTPTGRAADDILLWAKEAASRPETGSLMAWESKDGHTETKRVA